MSKHLIVPATEEGCKNARKWLLKYRRELKKKVEALVSKMCTEGEQTARIYLSHIDTGATYASIMAYREGNKGLITVGENAIWIEFGTGVYAEGQREYPYPVEKIVGHGEWGKKHGADPNGWYYFDETWQEVRHTYGIPADMFMYNTAQMLRRQYGQMAKEIFK